MDRYGHSFGEAVRAAATRLDAARARSLTDSMRTQVMGQVLELKNVEERYAL